MKKSLLLVSIVISNHNGKRYLDKCISSIKKLDYPKDKIEIILSDNASTDGSAAFVKRRYPEVRVLKNPDNNYCKGNNIAIKKAKGQYIALLNNDVALDRKWLTELVKVIISKKRIGAVGSKIFFMDGKINSAGHREYPNFYWGDRGFKEKDKNKYNRTEEIASLCGVAVLYKRECLDDVGLLDEDFIMYMEDIDMAIRCKNKNWKLVYVPKSKVHHVFHGTATEKLVTYYLERNRLLLIAKHYPNSLAKALFGKGYFAKENFKRFQELLPGIIVKLIENNKKTESVEKVMIAFFREINRMADYKKDYFYEDLDNLKKELRLGESLIKKRDALLKKKRHQFREKQHVDRTKR